MAPPEQNVLRYALTAEPTTFDPALVRDGPTIDLLFQVFEGLVQWDENNRLVPNLAERWEVSPDGRTYTFYLKRGVKFHNGREVTADDFKYSIERDRARLRPRVGIPGIADLPERHRGRTG